MSKPFILKYKSGKWVPHKRGGNPNDDTEYTPEDPPPEDKRVIKEVIIIYEGSQWVNIGGRWYRIG